jgi:hypothetical protein
MTSPDRTSGRCLVEGRGQGAERRVNLGFPTGICGDELADRAVVQAEKFGAVTDSGQQAAAPLQAAQRDALNEILDGWAPRENPRGRRGASAARRPIPPCWRGRSGSPERGRPVVRGRRPAPRRRSARRIGGWG